MWRKEAFKFSGIQKAIIGVVALLCIWRFLQVPAVDDAILNFFAGGEVPLTHKTLTPAGMIWAAVLVATLVILLILRKELLRLVRAARPERSQQADVVPLVPQIEAAAPWSIVVPVRTRNRSGKLGTIARMLLVGWLAAMVTFAKIAGAIGCSIVRAWHFTEPYIRRFDHWLELQVHAMLGRKPFAPVVDAVRDVATVLSIRKTN